MAGLAIRKILLDCKMRWSLTYQMLHLALVYCNVLDDMASDHTLGLRAFELDNNKWSVLIELAHVLKVRLFLFDFDPELKPPLTCCI